MRKKDDMYDKRDFSEDGHITPKTGDYVETDFKTGEKLSTVPNFDEGGMVHQDAPEDMDMIKNVLQKIIDEMNSMESDRMLPMGHPKKHIEIAAEVNPTDSQDDSTEPADEDSANPHMLDDLMNTAKQADDEGSTPDDHTDMLPPEVADAVRRKKALK